MLVILLAGCSGCDVKNAEQHDVDTPTKDPLLGDAGEIPLSASQIKLVEPQTPDSYQGDPYFYSPNIIYDEWLSTKGHDGHYSLPILPNHIQQQIYDINVWTDESGQLRTKAGPITKEEHVRLELDIIDQVFTTDLDMAKYLFVVDLYDRKYVQEYAQKALDKNPNDYNTLYVWTEAQTAPDKIVKGCRKLLAQNPNSAHVLWRIGATLVYDGKHQKEIEEGIGHLKRSAAIDPDLYKGAAFIYLGEAYLKLKDTPKALESYKRAKNIYHTSSRQYIIDSIEKREQP